MMRPVVSAIREKFGAVLGSAIAPDYAFAFRCLATVNSILYYDCSALMPYALDRSNGTSQVRGRISPDHADFLANLDGRGMNFAAPIPGLATALSSILHEYARVRDQGTTWPAVNWARYLAAIREEAALMDEGPMKRDTLRALEKFPGPPRSGQYRGSPWERAMKYVLSPKITITLAWMEAVRLSGLWRPIGRWTGTSAPDLRIRTTLWDTREGALAHARGWPRSRHLGMSRFEFLTWRELGRVAIDA